MMINRNRLADDCHQQPHDICGEPQSAFTVCSFWLVKELDQVSAVG